MKRIILLCLCLWSAMIAKGQLHFNMTFSYDDNGNRTGHVIQFSRSEEGDKNNLQEPKLLSSVLDSFNATEVSIYPNPTYDKVFVAIKGLENDQTMKVVLMSSSGKILYEKTMTNSEEPLDLSGVASGIYLLELTMVQEKHIWKVIKK